MEKEQALTAAIQTEGRNVKYRIFIGLHLFVIISRKSMIIVKQSLYIYILAKNNKQGIKAQY